MRRASLEGVVMNARLSPASGATVRLHVADASARARGRDCLVERALEARAREVGFEGVREVALVSANVDGTFRFDELVPEKSLVLVSGSDGTGASGVLAWDGGRESLEPLTLVPGRTVTVVIHERGLPSQGARVNVTTESEHGTRAWTVAAPATGRVELVVPDGSALTLSIAKPGCAVERRELEIGSDRTEAVELHPED